jgi:hypothetical protein
MKNNPEEVTARFRRLIASDIRRHSMTLEYLRSKGKGYICAVVSVEEKTQDEIIQFAEKKTEVSGWLVEVGFPTLSLGAAVWVLVKP